MITPIDRSTERRRIHKRIRQKISGDANRPRLCIYRSLKYIYAQIVDDTKGETLVAASTAEKNVRGDLKQGGNIQASKRCRKDHCRTRQSQGNRDGGVRSRRISVSRPNQGGCRGGQGIGT